MSYSDQVALRNAVYNRTIEGLHGDLLAVALLRKTMKRPLRDWAQPIDGIQAKKKLWTAHSRIISRVTQAIGVDDPNSKEGKLLRELVGLASLGVEEREGELCTK